MHTPQHRRPLGLVSPTWLSLRTTAAWPIPRSTLAYRPSRRLRELATPKTRNNIWSINMSEVGASFPRAPTRAPIYHPGALRAQEHKREPSPGQQMLTTFLDHQASLELA